MVCSLISWIAYISFFSLVTGLFCPFHQLIQNVNFSVSLCLQEVIMDIFLCSINKSILFLDFVEEI